jgi:hypothetical protein
MSASNVVRFGEPGVREALDSIVSREAQMVAGYTLTSAQIEEIQKRIWNAWVSIGDTLGLLPMTLTWPSWVTPEQGAELAAICKKEIEAQHVTAWRAAILMERVRREIEIIRG